MHNSAGAIHQTANWQLLDACCLAMATAASPRWEPQIAVLCEAGQIYQPQYLSEEGRWVTDLSKKTTGATCLRDKMDLLDYCKKVSEQEGQGEEVGIAFSN
ncbi:hypothetical protein AWZ03_014020 [Drosophila navojoa]|uniref:E1 domain-containing protein n=1 Tax=Drosophila navojoa TaxID=7232 RepID=A0A484AUL6_DRONA|nr:hypothetical protein AWZ03_014020 [Drosophila navojoa]